MKSIFGIILVFFFSTVFSQNTDNVTNIEESGRIIIKNNNKIKGNDFIYDEWNRGMLVLNDSVFSKQDYLKYDAYKNRVLIKNMKNLNEIIEVTDRTLTGFSILESEKNLKHDFVKLKSTSFEEYTETGFYEIVFNLQNTNYFIKRHTKVLFDPNRSKGSQTINNFPLEYQDKTTYYIKNAAGLYVKVRLKKKVILPILPLHTTMLKSYIKANKINFGKEIDVMQLVNFYYSL